MNGFILFIVIVCGLFSGFGTGIRYGFLDTDKNENDLMDTKLVKFYKNKLVSVLTTVLAFPVCMFIFMFIFVICTCFCPFLLFDLLTNEVVDVILRCFLALLSSQFLAYLLGMSYNQKHLKK